MKKLIAVICIILITISLVGCDERCVEDSIVEGGIIERMKTVQTDACYSIVVDTETGVMYLRYAGHGTCAMTAMLDAEGNPLIWAGAQ